MVDQLKQYLRIPLAITFLAFVSAGSSFADSDVTSDLAGMKLLLDTVWVIAAAALVMLMQLGFLLLEAGMVRSKNSINVAMKNVLDFAVSTIAFSVVGFMIAFGPSGPLMVGADTGMIMLRSLDSQQMVFFVFQVMFCGTAATIVSGGVAERMRLSSYAIGSLVIGGLIYPAFTHWSWGHGLGSNAGAFLGNMGFMDFAGSTVVHSTGGWLTLAACLVLGARKGRFDEEGHPVRFSGHSTVLASAGALFLFVGWIGFNGGSTLEANITIGSIVANTVIAGSAGGLAGYLWTTFRDKAVLPEKVLNGMIGGLVAVTAGCAVLDVSGAMTLGALGAIIANLGNEIIERKFKIDDAVGAIGAHAFAGIVGTLGLAVLAPPENLSLGSRLAQFNVQALGVGVNFLWAFGTGLILFYTLKICLGLRVDSLAEDIGLNESEHATRIGVGHVEDAMDHLVRGTADLSMRLKVENGDESERLVLTFNALLDNLQEQQQVISDAVENQRALEEAERLSALADATFEALCLLAGGQIIDGNAALSRLMGYSLDELRGRNLSDFLLGENASQLDKMIGAMSASVCEISITNAMGNDIPVEVRGRDIIYQNRKTRVLAIVDVRERKKAEDRIRYLAQHDPLTGLPNRALFNARLASMISKTVADGIMSSVILIDLDRFKDVNDLYGHAAGDEVLQATSERLLSLVRTKDTVARLGGDEFAILQVDINFNNQAADLAIRLLDELNKPIRLSDGHKVSVGASIGIAICPRDGIEGVNLISRADKALYHSKEEGRNQYAIFEPGMDEHVRHRQLLELDIMDAIEGEQFEVHFQPRMQAKTGEIVSYEALIRWNHPVRGQVSPAEFIPVAEGSGAIVKIGEWVMYKACMAAAHDMKTGQVSVNVSPLQFRDRRFIEIVRNILEETGLEPSRLEIEITENVLIDDDQRALSVFSGLKSLGIKIALDDFGTGYSSLGYLSRYPFDSLKIDRSFVQNLEGDRNGLEIIETIVRLGRALNMKIVAEGVETTDALSTLIECGCDEIQGFIVGAAQPIATLLEKAPPHVMQVIYPDLQVKTLKSVVTRMRALKSAVSEPGDKERVQG